MEHCADHVWRCCQQHNTRNRQRQELRDIHQVKSHAFLNSIKDPSPVAHIFVVGTRKPPSPPTPPVFDLTLRHRYLPPKCTPDEVFAHFVSCGPIVGGARLMYNNATGNVIRGFITFEAEEGFRNALVSLTPLSTFVHLVQSKTH